MSRETFSPILQGIGVKKSHDMYSNTCCKMPNIFMSW